MHGRPVEECRFSSNFDVYILGNILKDLKAKVLYFLR